MFQLTPGETSEETPGAVPVRNILMTTWGVFRHPERLKKNPNELQKKIRILGGTTNSCREGISERARNSRSCFWNNYLIVCCRNLRRNCRISLWRIFRIISCRSPCENSCINFRRKKPHCELRYIRKTSVRNSNWIHGEMFDGIFGGIAGIA